MPKKAFESLSILKKEKFIEVAKKLFAQRSIDELTSNDIIASLGVSRGCFYMYFVNKDDIFEYLIRDSGYRFYVRFKEEVANLNNLTIFDIMNSLFKFYTETEEGINEYSFIKNVIHTLPDMAREEVKSAFIGKKTINELFKYYSSYAKNNEYNDVIFENLLKMMFEVFYSSLRDFYSESMDVGVVRQNYKLKMAILKNGYAYMCHRANVLDDGKGSSSIDRLVDNDIMG